MNRIENADYLNETKATRRQNANKCQRSCLIKTFFGR